MYAYIYFAGTMYHVFIEGDASDDADDFLDEDNVNDDDDDDDDNDDDNINDENNVCGLTVPSTAPG